MNEDRYSDNGFLGQAQKEVETKGLLDFVAEIERFSDAEKKKTDLPDTSFTVKDKMEFWAAGLRVSLSSAIASLILVPFAFVAIEGKIPVFGTTQPYLFDKIFVLLLAIGFTLIHSLFLANVAKYNYGKITSMMTKQMYWGLTTGLIIKIITAFLGYHILVEYILTNDSVNSFLIMLEKIGVKNQYFLDKLYYFLMDIRYSLYSSFFFIFVTSLIFILVIWGYFYYYNYKNKNILAKEEPGGDKDIEEEDLLEIEDE